MKNSILDSHNLSNDAESYFLKGKNAYYEQSKENEALDYFNKAISLNPSYAEAYSEKGNVLMFLEKYNGALKCIEHAISLNSNYFFAYYYKARVLIALNKKLEAEEYFNHGEKLSASNDNNAENYFVRANTLSALGKNQEEVNLIYFRLYHIY